MLSRIELSDEPSSVLEREAPVSEFLPNDVDADEHVFEPAASQGSQGSRLSRASAPIVPTLFPKNPLWYYENLKFPHYKLCDIKPPIANRRVNLDNVSHDMSPIGRYLAARGFPCLGFGKSTVCFLITADFVAKVPRYQRDEGLFMRERSRDIAVLENHPLCFAPTRYVWVCAYIFPSPLGDYFPEHWFPSDLGSPEDDRRWIEEKIFIQDRLIEPFFRIRPDLNSRQVKKYDFDNLDALQYFYHREQNATQFAEWLKVMPNGQVIRRLVCFDYA